MKEMTCAHHDSLASRTQFVTHTIGRVLGAMDLEVRGHAGLASTHRGRTSASVRCLHIISTASPLLRQVSGAKCNSTARPASQQAQIAVVEA